MEHLAKPDFFARVIKVGGSDKRLQFTLTVMHVFKGSSHDLVMIFEVLGPIIERPPVP